MRQREQEGLYSIMPIKTQNNRDEIVVSCESGSEAQIAIYSSNQDLVVEEDSRDPIRKPSASGEGASHFRSLQRVDELNESIENLNSARSRGYPINSASSSGVKGQNSN